MTNKGEILGVVSDEKILLSKDIFLKPLPRSAFIRVYCSGCGEICGITKEGAEKLARLGNFQIPPNKEDFFLEIGGCDLPVCDSSPKDEVFLKKIEDL
ncbi:MAG: hypothetical protein WDK96_03610 [Candidatus Paceibacterota bacterium]|jgi:hypothetical protein